MLNARSPQGINGTLTSFPAAFTLISTITLLILNLLISLNALLPGLLVVVTGLYVSSSLSSSCC